MLHSALAMAVLSVVFDRMTWNDPTLSGLLTPQARELPVVSGPHAAARLLLTTPSGVRLCLLIPAVENVVPVLAEMQVFRPITNLPNVSVCRGQLVAASRCRQCTLALPVTLLPLQQKMPGQPELAPPPALSTLLNVAAALALDMLLLTLNVLI